MTPHRDDIAADILTAAGVLLGVLVGLGAMVRWWWPVLLVAVTGCAAQAQEAAPPLDPQIVALVAALNSSQGTDWAALLGDGSPIVAAIVAIGGLWKLGPSVGKDPEQHAMLARIDERTSETRREVRRIRKTVHWHAQCLTRMSSKEGTVLPDPPDPHDDSDDG